MSYLFVVLTLLVDAPSIDRVELDLDFLDLTLHNYFILNAIRGVSTVLCWVVVIVTNHSN